MAILRPLTVPRTSVAAHNPINFDSGRGAQGFFTPSSQYFGWEVIPHDNKWSDGTPSFMAPIAHYHLLQTEHFHVASGSGVWFVGGGGKQIRLRAGDDIAIPRFVAHRFESVPNDAGEPLVIWYRYDARRWEMEERFFRNMLTYLDDCRKHGVEPSLCQLCVFLADCWMPPDLVPFPGGDYVRCAVNTLFMWIMAFIGIFVFGYKRSYAEYYDPAISKKLIEEESKKAR